MWHTTRRFRRSMNQEAKMDRQWAVIMALHAPYYADTCISHNVDGWWACEREWTPYGYYMNLFEYLGKSHRTAYAQLRRWARNLRRAEVESE